MPKVICIEDVKSKLPSFVQIKENTYKGVRYKAVFIDLEYNEEFEREVRQVIKYQSGCKSRYRDICKSRRSSGEWRCGHGNKIPVETIRNLLPNYLVLDDTTYINSSTRAKFYDKEYRVWFEAIPYNIIKNGKVLCTKRQRDNFIKTISISVKEIQKRIFDLYDGRIILIEESYINTNSSALFLIDGKRVKYHVNTILSGWVLDRNDLIKWKSYVKVRDNFCCQKCNSIISIQSHHILTWATHPEHRFNINNGISLCKACHNDYHSLFKFYESLDNFCNWIKNPNMVINIKNRLQSSILDCRKQFDIKQIIN